MRYTRSCNCAGTEPGYPQHEWFCGMSDCSTGCVLDNGHGGECMDAFDAALDAADEPARTRAPHEHGPRVNPPWRQG